MTKNNAFIELIYLFYNRLLINKINTKIAGSIASYLEIFLKDSRKILVKRVTINLEHTKTKIYVNILRNSIVQWSEGNGRLELRLSSKLLKIVNWRYN